MDEKDREMNRMRQEIAKCKNRLIESCGYACYLCSQMYPEESACKDCRIEKIMKEATK